MRPATLLRCITRNSPGNKNKVDYRNRARNTVNEGRRQALPYSCYCRILLTVIICLYFLPAIFAHFETAPNILNNFEANSKKNFQKIEKISIPTKITDKTPIGRFKRQYYEDNYYSNYYGWQIGRLIGWTLGFVVLSLMICVPCICCMGIWFAGWFGLRRAMNTSSRRGNTTTTVIPGVTHHYPPPPHQEPQRIQLQRHQNIDNNGYTRENVAAPPQSPHIIAVEERRRVTHFENVPIDELEKERGASPPRQSALRASMSMRQQANRSRKDAWDQTPVGSAFEVVVPVPMHRTNTNNNGLACQSTSKTSRELETRDYYHETRRL